MMNEKYALGFDIGGTNIACGLVDGDNGIIEKRSCAFRPLGEDGIAGLMLETAREIARKSGVPLESIGALGVCIPGSVDVKNGVVIDAYNLELHDSRFRDVVEKRFGIKTALLNDADAAALAEARLGALKGTASSMLITIGTGIGVGIILGGKLFHGGRGMGVEAGHAVMDQRGEGCTCGRTGCIEALCSATWLAKRVHSVLGPASSVKTLVDMAKKGNALCKRIWDEYAENLGNALASYINILDPEVIALGGGVSGAGEFLIDSIRPHVDAGSFFREPTPIVLAKMGNDAGLVGACIYANEDK
ncbi:MAG: ROK family protein [Clostridia bacterium]|nr:ROK family protein [Clostridia bacterium]